MRKFMIVAVVVTALIALRLAYTYFIWGPIEGFSGLENLEFFTDIGLAVLGTIACIAFGTYAYNFLLTRREKRRR